LGFFAAGTLKKVDVTGGPPVAVAEIASVGGGAGGTWNREGTILVGSTNGIFRISQSGGAPEFVTNKESTKETGHSFPHFLPDGRRFIYLSTVKRTVYLASLDTRERTPLVEGATRAEYAAPAMSGEPGHLLYVRGTTLMAQSLDSRTYALVGDPVAVAEQLSGAFGGLAAFFSSSPSGVLAYRIGGSPTDFRLTWVDRSGGALGSVGPSGNYLDVALSPDANQVAVALMEGQSATASDIWLMDARQGVPSRLTTSTGAHIAPVWSPDGQKVAYSYAGETGPLDGFVRDVSGNKEQPVVKAGRIRDWSEDGRFLIYDFRISPAVGGVFRFWVLPLDGDRKPIEYALDRFNLAQGQFAPSGPAGPPKWIAYVSNESGANEVYVQSFPPSGRGIRVSNNGGQEPRWRRDGKELFYIAPGGRVMSVDVALAPTFTHESAKELFKAPIASGGPRAFAFHYDVAADGKRFLLITTPQAEASAPSPITVVLNWQAALKK
jgi:Tol biopolymer transport system component